MSGDPEETLVASLKRAAAALRDAGIPFALGGGFAAWARGAPPTEHDVDLFVRRDDTDRALQALENAGMKTERPPEEWLVKAWDDDVLVDVIFAPAGFEVTSEVLRRAEEFSVAGMEMPVLPATDVFVSRLLALDEHHLDFSALLVLARALREQVDWEAVATRTEASPFARTFLYLLEELRILGPQPGTRAYSGGRGPGGAEATASAISDRRPSAKVTPMPDATSDRSVADSGGPARSPRSA